MVRWRRPFPRDDQLTVRCLWGARGRLTSPCYEVRQDAWAIWGWARLIKQRLACLGRLPKRHARAPISLTAMFDGIGKMHKIAIYKKRRYDQYCRSSQCDLVQSRLADGIRKQHDYWDVVVNRLNASLPEDRKDLSVPVYVGGEYLPVRGFLRLGISRDVELPPDRDKPGFLRATCRLFGIRRRQLRMDLRKALEDLRRSLPVRQGPRRRRGFAPYDFGRLRGLDGAWHA